MKVELGKQYRTKDGKEVRIYAVDAGEYLTVHGAIKHENPPRWLSYMWSIQGRASDWAAAQDYSLNLVEVKPRHKRIAWVNAYPNGQNPTTWAHKSEADRFAQPGRIACIRVELDFEEGEGL